MSGSASFQGEEISVRGAAQLKMCECANGFVDHNAAMVEDFLELCGGFGALPCGFSVT